MEDRYNWYVLYTKTGAEERVQRGILEAFRKRRLRYHFFPFCPKVECYFRTSKSRIGGNPYRIKLLFPNYVFIETDIPEDEFICIFQKFVFDSSDILKLLQYSEKRIALDIKEKERIESLLDKE